MGGSGIEPLTSSVSRKRSPTELTARASFISAYAAQPPVACAKRVLTLQFAFDNLEQHLQKGVPMKPQSINNCFTAPPVTGVIGIPMLTSKWSGAVFFERKA